MRLILGTEQLGGVDWGKYSLKECQKAFSYAIDLGLNKIDTANIYGLGVAEKSISKILGKKIQNVQIISKIGLSKFKAKNRKRAKIKIDLSKKALEKNIKSSLKNLNVDYLNTCLIHWPDHNIDYLETIELLKNFKKIGYIQNFGFSNYETIINKCHINKLKHFQLKFNLLTNKNYKFINEFSKKIDVSIYGILAHGLLTGKYSSNNKFNINDRRHRLKEFNKKFETTNKKKILFLRKCADELDLPLSTLCIAITYQLLPKANLIIGFKNINQIKQNIESFQIKVPKEIISEYRKIFINLS